MAAAFCFIASEYAGSWGVDGERESGVLFLLFWDWEVEVELEAWALKKGLGLASISTLKNEGGAVDLGLDVEVDGCI